MSVSQTTIENRLGEKKITDLVSDGVKADIVAACIASATNKVAAYSNSPDSLPSRFDSMVEDIAIYYLFMRRGRAPDAVIGMFEAAIATLDKMVDSDAMSAGSSVPQMNTNDSPSVNLHNEDYANYQSYPATWTDDGR